ncbi:winged helix-turn-helix transcriptional regulator [Lactobacillus sp. PV012]|uniref:winged helix-turn-helix transcriptional regulator n=1 Tax=Lactobacillus sp. PV012 TaxID=2594494 RepID=UPI0022405B97|nr:helix-turn-helix domain-containing protein [Lactobacillus sp. PV012]
MNEHSKREINNFQTQEMEPFNKALDLISGKWKMNILYALSTLGTLRYGEIQRLLGNVTHRVLANKLKELEEKGLISRTVYPEIPPKVEYTITKKGKSLLPILKQICDWGKANETSEI